MDLAILIDDHISNTIYHRSVIRIRRPRPRFRAKRRPSASGDNIRETRVPTGSIDREIGQPIPVIIWSRGIIELPPPTICAPSIRPARGESAPLFLIYEGRSVNPLEHNIFLASFGLYRRPHKTRYGQRSEKPDDHHNDHQLDERKAMFFAFHCVLHSAKSMPQLYAFIGACLRRKDSSRIGCILQNAIFADSTGGLQGGVGPGQMRFVNCRFTGNQGVYGDVYFV